MSRKIRLSSSVTKFIATPFLPKRPPRPILQEERDGIPGEDQGLDRIHTGHVTYDSGLTGECSSHGLLGDRN